MALARAKHFVEPIVGLYHSHVAVIAEVSRQPFADQRATLLNKLAQLGDRLTRQHHRIRQIDDLVLVDIIDRDKVGLYVRVEECLVRASNRLRIEGRIALLHVIEDLRLGHKHQADVAFDRARLP